MTTREHGRLAFEVSAAVILSAALLLLGCAPKAQGQKLVTLDQLIEGAREQGLFLENPIAVDPAIAAEVEEAVGRGGTPAYRMGRLTRYLNKRGFAYEANKSLTADEAFKARRGDCMAYTNLYLGLARCLGVHAFFIHIDEARNYYERDGMYFVSSHMAVGCAAQYYTVIVDFTEQKSEYALALYDQVDDTTAAGLFYNNLAVDHMLAGDLGYAESLLRYLLTTLPSLKEAQNNLGVILMRQERFEEALRLYQDAILKHPDYQSLYTNAVQAAKGAGERELATELQAQGERFLRRDPFFIFNQGLALYEKKDYDGAMAEFNKILSRQPKSPVLFAWIAKVELSRGRVKEGIQAFERAQSLAPFLPMLKALRRDFPALQGVPEPPDSESPPPAPIAPVEQQQGPPASPPASMPPS
jgi:tetratricopeptide (TPR) repeat protein